MSQGKTISLNNSMRASPAKFIDFGAVGDFNNPKMMPMIDEEGNNSKDQI